jgi:hypothetical protein
MASICSIDSPSGLGFSSRLQVPDHLVEECLELPGLAKEIGLIVGDGVHKVLGLVFDVVLEHKVVVHKSREMQRLDARP